LKSHAIKIGGNCLVRTHRSQTYSLVTNCQWQMFLPSVRHPVTSTLLSYLSL